MVCTVHMHISGKRLHEKVYEAQLGQIEKDVKHLHRSDKVIVFTHSLWKLMHQFRRVFKLVAAALYSKDAWHAPCMRRIWSSVKIL